MSTYLLIHGAWHGGWAWENVAQQLIAKGHTVLCPDLPGHGANTTPLTEITMNAYVQTVVKLLDKQSEPVILVGHSMSGAVISQAADQHPSMVSKLVYVCAFLLQNGGSVLEAMKKDEAGEFLPRLTFTNDQSGASFNEATLREVFYNETPEHRIQWAQPQLMPIQPTQPLGASIRISNEGFGSIPRTYIKCMRDKISTPDTQQHMIEILPCEKVFELEADHAPFLSKPEELSNALLSM
jgi:pimeloyl-ACP methyl ester carboxylesterase